MKLPPELAAEFRARANADPQIVARALYDMDGNLGETYIAATGQALSLFSKRIGEAFQPHHFRFEEVAGLSLRTDGLYVICRVVASERKAELKFTSWDRPKLDELLGLWNATNPSPAVEEPEPASVESPAATPVAALEPFAPSVLAKAPEAAPALTPLLAFCASIHAMAASDGKIDPSELDVLARLIPDRAVIRQGSDYLQRHGVDGLLRQLDSVLDESQKLCLMANVVSVAMVDGVFDSREQDLIEQFKSALAFDQENYDAVFDVLLLKNNIAIFAEEPRPPDEWHHDDMLTPLTAFCAAMFAMVQADEHVHDLEWQVLTGAIHDAEAVGRGVNHMQTYGVDFLLSVLPELLNAEQKRCLYANLLRVAMADGLLRGREQELLDRFQAALEISGAESEAIRSVLMLKNNLSVFCGE